MSMNIGVIGLFVIAGATVGGTPAFSDPGKLGVGGGGPDKTRTVNRASCGGEGNLRASVGKQPLRAGGDGNPCPRGGVSHRKI